MGLGLPRPAGGERSGKPARPQDPRRHHRLRHRPVQRVLPAGGAALHRRMADADPAAGPLGRLGPPVPDHGHRLHGVGLVGIQVALGSGPDLRRLQVARLLPAVRHAAVQLRGQPGVPGRAGPVDHRPLPGARRAGAVDPGLDHHAVDAAVEHGAGRGQGDRLRAGRHRGRRIAHSGPRPPGRRVRQAPGGDRLRPGATGCGTPGHDLRTALRRLYAPARRGGVPGRGRRLRVDRRRHRRGPRRAGLRRR